MSTQGTLVERLVDYAPAPEQSAGPAIPPATERYAPANLLYMAAFGAVAWVGGKIAEKIIGPTVESTIKSGKALVNSFSSDDDPEEEEEEDDDGFGDDEPEDEEPDEEE